MLMEAAPDTRDHVPLPTTGVFAAKIPLVTLHNLIVSPAIEGVGGAAMVMVMSSVELTHAPLAMLQRSVVEPMESALREAVSELALLMVAVPETKLQRPVPIVGMFAARVDVETLHRF